MHKAETPARASAGDCLPALMMAGRSVPLRIEANHGRSASVQRGAGLHKGVKDVPRKAVDMTAQFFEPLLEGVARIVAERDKARMDELTERILAKLQKAATLPQMPAELPQERLLRPNEVAELLACSEDKLKKRMDAGDLAYIVERGSDRRRIPYSWVVEYIHKHKRYTGPLGKRKEVEG